MKTISFLYNHNKFGKYNSTIDPIHNENENVTIPYNKFNR